MSLAWNLHDQIHARIAVLLEVVLLHRPQISQPLQQQAAHGQKSSFIPAGMTRPGDERQIGPQPLFHLGITGMSRSEGIRGALSHLDGSRGVCHARSPTRSGMRALRERRK